MVEVGAAGWARRSVLAVLVLAVLAALFAVTVERADAWTVRDANGKKIGSVDRTGIVRNAAGKQRGMVFKLNTSEWLAERRVDGVLRNQMSIRKNYPGLERWTCWSADPVHLTGRIVKRHGRWCAESVDDVYHLNGTVARACPAPLAGGAVFALRPKLWPYSW